MSRENWGRNNRRNGSWQRSAQSRPPPPLGCQSSVPSWEKKFCVTVGSVPWHKLMEAKKFLHLYSDIIDWKDSACEEAFKNAKQRYWADINGIPCDIKPPDPDIYIDEIDWNPKIDPVLMLDLEEESVPLDLPEQGPAIVNLESLLEPADQIPCTGWDDNHEEQKATGMSMSIPHIVGCDSHVSEAKESRDKSDGWVLDGGRENGWDGMGELNGSQHDAVKENRGDHLKDWNDVTEGGESKGWETWKVGDDRKREAACCYPSRYTSPAFHRDSYQVHRGSSNGRFREGPGFGYREAPLVERLPSYWRW